MDFKKFPKIARLSREMIITEKIDGTNAQIFIEDLEGYPSNACLYQNDGLALWAGSRNRWITPDQDNHGFARWAYDHAEELLELGPGRHYGEWWGSGIQRGYGLPKGEKRFSLFNVQRWSEGNVPKCCHVVPIILQGLFSTTDVDTCLRFLAETGSLASPGFMDPEGLVVFHVAGNVGFKKTIKKDDEPKGKRP